MIRLKKSPRNPQIWKLLKNNSTHTAKVPRITASDCKNPVSSSYCGFVSLLFSEALAPVLVVLFLGVCADFCVVFDVVFGLADACDCFVVSFCFLVPAKCFSPFNFTGQVPQNIVYKKKCQNATVRNYKSNIFSVSRLLSARSTFRWRPVFRLPRRSVRTLPPLFRPAPSRDPSSASSYCA